MVHYAAIPEELIFGQFNQNKAKSQKEIFYQGIRMIVEPINFREAKIIKILSSDPQDYINPLFQPGAVIKF
ncbi:MAG: hypothetical protein PWQ82_511 [Thermosediminibacterales bacterium]|nr:hypothetical protein [Thermosediminibacterales bacterium]